MIGMIGMRPLGAPLILLACGVVLGALASVLAIRKYLKV
mgnify:CR=1 FL=1